MNVQTITPISISRCINATDMYYYHDLLDPDKRDELITSAFKKSMSSQLSFDINKLQRNGKICYTLKKYDQILLSRHLANNVRQVLSKSKSRNKISRQLVQHLKEGTSYRLYRLDIKSFFESVSFSTIQEVLDTNSISTQTKSLITSIINHSDLISGKGLPRGIEFSAPIAELILKEFDEAMRMLDNVFFYCRYVDDIIVITTGFESVKNFIIDIKRYLPCGLSFNYNKQRIIDVPKRGKVDKKVGSFDFLGYKYTIRDTLVQGNANKSLFREIDVSLSVNRIKKIKTRIAKALYIYSRDGGFELLKDRIDFLTSNRLMKKKNENRLIATGIYYSNSNLTSIDNGMKELDLYLKKIILGYFNKRSSGVLFTLTAQQKRLLLSCSFVNGYRNDNYKKFAPNKLNEIKDAWRY